MSIFTVGFDQDQVLADLHTPWLAEYNKDYNDNMKPENVTNWDIETLVKPECGKKIFDYIKRPGFYRHLAVIDGAQKVTSKINRMDIYDVAVVTATPKMAYMDKYEWIEENFPFINEDNIMAVRNKALARTHFLIDDKLDNLIAFEGIGIIFDAPYNREHNSYTDSVFTRVKDWTDIDILFTQIIPSMFMCMSGRKERVLSYLYHNKISVERQIAEIRKLSY